jgi:hypothetical protein
MTCVAHVQRACYPCPAPQAIEFINILRKELERVQLENMDLKQTFLNEIQKQQMHVQQVQQVCVCVWSICPATRNDIQSAGGPLAPEEDLLNASKFILQNVRVT